MTYSQEQLSTKLLNFDSRCAYCERQIDDINVLDWDHVIAISKGGPDVLGNLVPSCQACNRSKSNHDALEWFQRQPFWSSKRWQFILNHLGILNGHHIQLPLF